MAQRWGRMPTVLEAVTEAKQILGVDGRSMTPSHQPALERSRGPNHGSPGPAEAGEWFNGGPNGLWEDDGGRP
jgi:hypothetical protein